MSEDATRRVFVDASVFITLAEIDYTDLLAGFDGEVVVPSAVVHEVSDDPAASHLATATEDWLRIDNAVETAGMESVVHAATHLDAELDDYEGDVALLAFGTTAENPVVVTDDKPLRNACKALGVPLSGSVGVLVASVERGTLAPAEAKDALVAMDEVGARLSARLLRRAEKLIDRAGE
ncbi:DUF3368 domain-containing protein [Halorussus amylolyticus]|uniref:DUF3368 domain-containing protein n=1 Tax=Halorussus amylolyticus TaxID=1126242 RepID=UPI00104515B5|nr:DUF3368 domain-containing protein [Halorussus amylolyticus]